MSSRKPQLANCLVSFIDILGMKNKVLEISTEKQLLEVHDELVMLQGQFAKSNIQYDKICGKEVIAVSDSVIISLNFKAPIIKDIGSFDAMMSELHTLGLSQAICVCDKNIFLRGGIDIGTWYHKNNILVSPSLVKAHLLERDYAEFPIIALTDDAYDFFKNHPHRRHYAKVCDPVKQTFQKTKSNGKNIYFIDYLVIGFGAAANWNSMADLNLYKRTRNEDKRLQILKQSYEKTQREFLIAHGKAVLHGIRHFSKHGDNIKKKYTWLMDYHNAFVDKLGAAFHDCKIVIQ